MMKEVVLSFIICVYNHVFNINMITNNFFYSPTKASMVASIIFVLDKKTDLISAPHALVYFGIVIFFVYFKVKSIFSIKYLLKIYMFDTCKNKIILTISFFSYHQFCLAFMIHLCHLKICFVLYSWEEFGIHWLDCLVVVKLKTRKRMQRKQIK